MTLSATAEMPRGEAIARYTSYAEAQKAVDYLADQQFEVAKVSIIGSDLKSVEQVTGRLSYPKVALQGALNGVVFGAFFGLLMSLLGGMDLAQALLLPIIMGGAFWMLLATITYAMQRGKRDFTSTNRIVAGSYEVIAAPEVAGEARNVLGGLNLPQAPAPRPQQGGWNQPPQGGWNQPPQGPNGQGGQWGPPQGQWGPQGGAPQQQSHPNGPAQQGQPAHGQPQHQGQQQHQAANRSAKFPDLPDGRPQYGIRLEPEAPAQSQPQPQQGSSAVNAPWSKGRPESQDSPDSGRNPDR